MSVPSVHRLLAASSSATFEDPVNGRTIHLVVAGLFVVAVALAAVTAWWWITSRVEHPALGPLEVMGTKRWLEADDGLRRVRLDAARPEVEPTGTEVVVDPAPQFAPSQPGPGAPRDPLLQARRER